ncbi:MAG: VOC family protein [Ferruginibacter sp.]
MSRRIAHIALVVHDYDEAIQFYKERLNFILIEDTVLSETKRWVMMSPGEKNGCLILLAKAANEEQHSRVGNQTGGRVFLFLYTDDLQKEYENLLNKKVTIVREPVTETWGKVLVFADLYGNLWDMIEPSVPDNT